MRKAEVAEVVESLRSVLRIEWKNCFVRVRNLGRLRGGG
jgi:hypothetical protein